MGEYEPEDSRNVTGTATTPDGRWTNTEGKTPKPGQPTLHQTDDEEGDEDGTAGAEDARRAPDYPERSTPPPG